jgi:hypothetical protein
VELGGHEEAVPLEVPAQEGPEAGEQDAELPKCQDHQSSSFLKGKPRNILLPVVCKYLTCVPLCLMHYVIGVA